MKKRFYVTQMKTTMLNNQGSREEYVNLFSFEEAVKHHWIDSNGNRIWVVPPEEEFSITAVYGFDNINEAINFYVALTENQVGIVVHAN